MQSQRPPIAGPHLSSSLSMTILYDADHLGTLRTVGKLQHTMLVLVGKSPAFWLLMALHGGLLVADRYSDTHSIPRKPPEPHPRSKQSKASV